MKTHVNFQDAIDLEYFLDRDSDKPAAMLHNRDRHIFLQALDQEFSDSKESVPAVKSIKTWLQARRDATEDPAFLPGTLAAETLALLRLIIVGLSLFTGGSAGLLFFSYSGETPVNVLHFLLIFVFSQLLLTAIWLLRGSLYAVGFSSLPNTLSMSALARVCSALLVPLRRWSRSKLKTKNLNALQATLGRISSLQKSSGSLFFWPLFVIAQLSGIFFNIGLLATTMFKVAVTDIAFGWQSTLQFSSQSLYTFCKYLATPWSWFMQQGLAHPSLPEIDGSRILLKEGISHLTTENLVAWWPFLLLCVLCYGLLVRVVMYLFGCYGRSRAAASVDLDTPTLRQVIRRMQTPIVSTQADPETANEKAGIIKEMAVPPAKPLPETSQQNAHLLLPDELHDLCDHAELKQLLAAEGYRITAFHRFMVDYSSDRELLKELTAADETGAVVILMEAWMPPLVDFLSFLTSLRKGMAQKQPILIRLIGKPADASILTAVAEGELKQTWQQKITSLADPYLHLAPLVGMEVK